MAWSHKVETEVDRYVLVLLKPIVKRKYIKHFVSNTTEADVKTVEQWFSLISPPLVNILNRRSEMKPSKDARKSVEC